MRTTDRKFSSTTGRRGCTQNPGISGQQSKFKNLNSSLTDNRPHCAHRCSIRRLSFARALGGLEGALKRIAGRPFAEGDSGGPATRPHGRARKEADPSLSFDEGEGNALTLTKLKNNQQNYEYTYKLFLPIPTNFARSPYSPISHSSGKAPIRRAACAPRASCCRRAGPRCRPGAARP